MQNKYFEFWVKLGFTVVVIASIFLFIPENAPLKIPKDFKFILGFLSVISLFNLWVLEPEFRKDYEEMKCNGRNKSKDEK